MISLNKDCKLKDGQKVRVYKNKYHDIFTIYCSETEEFLARGFDFLLLNSKPVYSHRPYVEGNISTKFFLYDIYRLDDLNLSYSNLLPYTLKKNKIDFKEGDLWFTKYKVEVVVTEKSRHIRSNRYNVVKGGLT